MEGRVRPETLTAWAIGAGILLGTYDTAALAVALPHLGPLWHIGPGGMGLVGSAAVVGMLLGSLAAGPAADHLGRRRILLTDFVLYGMAGLATALSMNLATLVASRLFVGLALGADYAVAFPYLAEVSGPRGRGRVMATVLWAANFGMLAAYAMGALTASWQGGWRIPFVIGLLLVVPVLWFRRRVPESSPWQAARRAPGGDRTGLKGSGLVWRTVLSSSGAWFCYQVSDQGLSLFLPLMLVTLLGTSIAGAAWHAVLIKAVTIPAAALTVATIERWGRRPLQVWGFWLRGLALVGLTGEIGVWGLARVDRGWTGALLWTLLIVLFAAGAWGPDKTTVITAAERSPTSVRATGQGIAEAAGRLGGLVGIAGYSALVPLGGMAAGLAFFAVLTMLGAVISQFTLPETARSAADARPALVSPGDRW